MKTIYCIIVLLFLGLNIMAQEISYEKGETETYKIRSDKETKFIFRVGTPFNERAPMFDVPLRKYRLWPKNCLLYTSDAADD